MLTVRRLTDDLGLRVLAGGAGLDAAVRWVHISELPDPTPWLSGGELLLTTAMRVGDRGAGYVSRLAEHGVSALGVGVGMDGGVDAVPPEMLAEAGRRGFPVFEVPAETPFLAITERAAAHIVNEGYATLQRAIAAHEELQGIVLGGGGLGRIAQALAERLGGRVGVLDARGGVMAGERLDEPDVSLPVARRAGDPPQAWLVALKQDGEVTEFDRLLLHQSVTIVALELLRSSVAADTERRLAGDVLASVLSAELTGAELCRRLEPFGLRERVAAVVLAPPPEMKDAVDRALAVAVGAEAGGGLAAAAGQLSCALVPVPDGGEKALFALAERLRGRVARDVGRDLPAGAGRAVPVAEARRAFHEGRCAVESRMLSGARGGLATYRDLGSFQLLLSLQDDDALRLFCDSILAPVEGGEGQYGEELVRSLEVFIECNGQWERAARRLSCHRHTLRYRIRRVEELTGRSLDSARDRIDFWLALRGRELMN